MKLASTIVQMLIRLGAVILLILGLLFWTRNALSMVPVHTMLGYTLVVLMWVQAGLSLRFRAPIGLVALTAVWGILMGWLGMAQYTLMVGDLHWIIQVLHLVVGLVGVGLTERLFRYARQWSDPQAAAPVVAGTP